jgi:competence protein ComEC
VWHAPLVALALAVTGGILLHRYTSIPLPVSLLAIAICLAAWAATATGRPAGLSLVYLAGAAVGLGAAYHAWYRDVYPPDDIGNFISPVSRPVLLRGVVAEGPVVTRRRPDPLQSVTRSDRGLVVLQVTHLKGRDGWLAVSGRARLVAAGSLPEFHVGDEVEVAGRLLAPQPSANPGELDWAATLRDRGIRALVVVEESPDAVSRMAVGWPWTLHGWLAAVRGWGQRVLRYYLPEGQRDVATVLLLGEGATMSAAEWEKYARSGVLHVLAISGQHLAVLAVFLWLILRLLAVRLRWGAVGVALFLLAYALLTGGRPPVLRSAVMVCAACGGLMLRRPALTANTFALAWLAVAAVNPTDLFSTGCQLSFLSVAIVIWGTGHWVRPEADPLERLVEATRPRWEKVLLWLARSVAYSYGVAALVWLGIAPLVAARTHLVSPIALAIGPPTALLTSIALIAGFLLLLSEAVCPPFVWLFAWTVRWSLAAADFLVDLSLVVPGGNWYVDDIATWWLWVFYPALLAALTLEPLRRRWRWAILAGLAWLCVGLLAGSVRPAAQELRCTFLAVGHGGCTVLETPDGRTLLYDAGAMAGPDVTRRQIAPFLWSRGIRRIDEVFLSHGDLDHFNALPALLDRFAVGQVTYTPTFADRTSAGVRFTLAELERRGIPVRTVRAGDRLSAGGVELEVLHPPASGSEGNENARSLVLLVRHAGHALLLTGDLEGPGLDRVLALAPPRVDVLMAPHHGSRTANKPELAEWARPKVVVSCQGPPRHAAGSADPYAAVGAHFLGTWPHGAVTVRSTARGLTVETFLTGQRFTIRPDPAR